MYSFSLYSDNVFGVTSLSTSTHVHQRLLWVENFKSREDNALLYQKTVKISLASSKINPLGEVTCSSRNIKFQLELASLSRANNVFMSLRNR